MLLELKNLSKSFGAVVVAADVSLAVEDGEALGIIGPNGAGKSSVFNLVSGTLEPDSGSVLLDGADVTREPPRRRVLAGIGRSHQIPLPFEHLTVFENTVVAACFGTGAKEDAARDRVVEILHMTKLLPKANLPAGALTLLERKRLEMTRALATGPKLLLLDEIAGGLTEGECQELVATIQEIRADGMTIIWIEHVTHALLAVVDRLVALDFGKIIAEGAPREVMNSESVQRIYMGVD
ncbi:MAG: ABC transporter ATP-binding protein [Albidovulum sp.]|nr:ABC transporter ATP-binding protein [Albidovulum sp.]